MVPRTRASAALRKALAPGADQRMSQRELAKQLGIASASVSAWKDSTARPEVHFRRAVERLLGIPFDDWMTAAEKRIADGPRARSPKPIGGDGDGEADGDEPRPAAALAS